MGKRGGAPSTQALHAPRANHGGRADDLVTVLTTGHTADAAIVTRLPVDRVADDSSNPRGGTLGDLDELAASIASVGVLQPIIVAPAHHVAETDSSDRWLVVTGHRRLAACRKAGLPVIPALVRDDLSDRTAATIAAVVENVHRADLTPLAEARGYQLLVDLEISQREIARRCGVNQSRVSRRLSLLRLPERARDDLDYDRLQLTEALKLAELPPEHQESTYAEACERRTNALVPIESTIRHKNRKLEDARRTDEARRQAEEEGVRLVDPSKEFGSNWYQHRLDNDVDIERARKAGALAADPTPSGLVYYSTQRADSEGSARTLDDHARIEERERRAATQARTSACERLVAKRLRQTDLVAALASCIVGGRLEYARSLKLAHGWLRGKVGAPVDDPYEWADSLGDVDPAARAHVAYALTVANDELRARWEHSAWDARTVAYIDRLISETGYRPSPWEQGRLEQVRGAHATSETP